MFKWLCIILTILILGNLPSAIAQISTPTPTPTPIPQEPEGCLTPPDDYDIVEINGQQLNERTIAMLTHAQTLYGGTIELTGRAITQGSYNAGQVALSFGTHDAGGAVDISVRNLPINWEILWDDIPILLEALRTAGFAAWYRDEDDGMSPHIHAIAIGDKDLSYAATLQLDGRYGYFRGFNGLPKPNGVPEVDTDGDFILCDWMRELGYQNLRNETVIIEPPYTFEVGDQVYVNTVWGGELNLRAEPTVRATILQPMLSETPLTIVGDSQLADGYRWWLLRTEDGTLGWAVEASDGGYTLVK